MFARRVRLLALDALLFGLICIIAIICGNVSETNGILNGGDSDGGSNQAAETSLVAQNPEAPIPYDDRILIEKHNSLILLALEEFCSIHPRECYQDHSNSASSCVTLGDRFICAPITSMTSQEERRALINQRESINDMLIGIKLRDLWTHKNKTSPISSHSSTLLSSLPADELGEGQSWTPKLMTVTNERDVGTTQFDGQQQAMRKKILDLLTNHEQTLAVGTAQPLWISRPTRVGVRHGLFKRDQAGISAQKANPNMYWVTLEEARRLIKAHQRQSSLPALTTSILFAPNALSRIRYPDQKQNLQSLLTQQPLTNSSSSSFSDGTSDLLIVPKRADSSADMRPGSGISRSGGSIRMKMSGHHQLQEELERAQSTASSSASSLTSSTTSTTTTKPPDQSSGNPDDSMKCTMRKFTYKASKTDEAGNQCTGLVTASICYGGCDTGEIADWLFPHKKSIHKVCRHGGRIRQHTKLTYCTSSSGVAVAPDKLGSLAHYHYVDALNCVCKKCTSADTTCLGTMSRPHLQTLGEAVAEIGQQQQQQQQQHQQQQQPLPAIRVETGSNDGGGD